VSRSQQLDRPGPPAGPPGDDNGCTVLHVDMDAFYASVEQRDRPELRGRPVVVGGNGRRGVVSTASYEARKFGVKSAMATMVAKRLCPHAIFVPVRMSAYVEVSKQVMAIFGRFSPLIEPLSLDEAFVDATGTDELFGAPVELAWRIQRAVREETQLTCSVGAASNKYVAKVASDLKKPAGIVVVNPGEERQFLAPLPIERLWGVGPKTSERLRADGFDTIADIAAVDTGELIRRYGQLGQHISLLSRGEDDRPIDDDHQRKSLGAERTLEHDITGAAAVRSQLIPLIDEVSSGLRKAHLRAGGVRLKLKYADFHRTSREVMLPEPSQDAASLTQALEHLLPKADLSRPMRLVGLAATHLVDEAAPRQASLFDAPNVEKHEKLGRAMDLIQQKHGRGAITRGDARDGERIDRGNEHLDD
jgi:DNA polymerase-4